MHDVHLYLQLLVDFFFRSINHGNVLGKKFEPKLIINFLIGNVVIVRDVQKLPVATRRLYIPLQIFYVSGEMKMMTSEENHFIL